MARADELPALLGPGRARTREHPRRPGGAAVVARADQRGVAVSGDRDAKAESPGCDFARAGELCALLDPRVDPQRIARAGRIDLLQKPPAVKCKPAMQRAPAGVGCEQARVT